MRKIENIDDMLRMGITLTDLTNEELIHLVDITHLLSPLYISIVTERLRRWNYGHPSV